MHIRIFAASIAVVLLFTGSAVRGEFLRTVALSDQQAPDTTSGVTFERFSSAVINSSGKVALRATLQGSGINDSNNVGVWSEGTGTLSLVARANSPAPGLPNGVRFNDLWLGSELQFNNAGQTAFIAGLTGSGINTLNETGVWSEGSGALALVAREGTQAPGAPNGVVFFEDHPQIPPFNDLSLNSQGELVFDAELSVTLPNSTLYQDGLWYASNTNSVSLVAMSGDTLPTVPTETTTVSHSVKGTIGDLGQITFTSVVSTPSGNHRALWHSSSGSYTFIAGSNLGDPGFPAGTTLSGPTNVSTNLSGEMVMDMGLIGAGITSSNDDSLVAFRGGQLELLFREGDPLPGAPTKEIAIFDNYYISEEGSVAFNSVGIDSVDSSLLFGIWSEDGGTFEPVALSGEQAPGTPSGTFFGRPGLIGTFAMNSGGLVAFSDRLEGPGIDATNDIAIFVEDLLGNVRLVAREGDEFEVGPGDIRTIATVTTLDGPSQFNDAGELVFELAFIDGSSGVFVSSIASIPEPSTVLLAAIGLSFAVSIRRVRCSCFAE